MFNVTKKNQPLFLHLKLILLMFSFTLPHQPLQPQSPYREHPQIMDPTEINHRVQGRVQGYRIRHQQCHIDRRYIYPLGLPTLP